MLFRSMLPSDLLGVAEARYALDSEYSFDTPLPRTSLQERLIREKRRVDLAERIGDFFTYVVDVNGVRIKSILDVEPEPCLHGPEIALNAVAITKPPYRLEGCVTGLLKFATQSHGTTRIRTALPRHLMLSPKSPKSPAIELLRKQGFKAQIWKQLSRVYNANDFSLLGQIFWDTTELPLRFGEGNELELMRAEVYQISDVAKLRLQLAQNLGYVTHYEAVEASVANLVVRPSGTTHHSVLLAVVSGKEVVGSVRVTPKYSVWDGMEKLEIRDIVISKPFQNRGLLKWIFNAAVLAGRTFLRAGKAVNNAEPILVETWLPKESLVRHFQREVPGLIDTGRQYFENC